MHQTSGSVLWISSAPPACQTLKAVLGSKFSPPGGLGRTGRSLSTCFTDPGWRSAGVTGMVRRVSGRWRMSGHVMPQHSAHITFFLVQRQRLVGHFVFDVVNIPPRLQQSGEWGLWRWHQQVKAAAFLFVIKPFVQLSLFLSFWFVFRFLSLFSLS